ncbi:MAG: TMEM175 family protein [Bacteroidota bacterium]
MGKGRLEAFSDGVMAIIITIMVLEMKVPVHGNDWAALKPLYPVFMSYVLSFIYIAIYWNNHHHMMHAAHKINGKVMWANNHLLFWLSLMPFTSGWMGENHFAALPTALFGVILFMAGVAYYILEQTLLKIHGKESTLAKAVGNDPKGIISVVLYAIAIVVSFTQTWISLSIYTIVAIIWLIPDKRIENKIAEEQR